MGSVEVKLKVLLTVTCGMSNGGFLRVVWSTDARHDRTDLSFKVALNTIPSISLQTYELDIHLTVLIRH